MSSRSRWPIAQLKEARKLTLDGPYGQDLNLHLYENVFLAAQGVGIAGVLPWALELAQRRHHDNEIRYRIQYLAEEQAKLLREEKTAFGDRLEEIRKRRNELMLERKTLRSKRLFLDATTKVVLFWTLEDNLQMDMRFLVVWCGYPNIRTEKTPPFHLSQFWKCLNPSPEDFETRTASSIQEERTKVQGQIIVVG
ncbi:hypothetical protein EsDP_00007300 [Epichloe bromicola]|uniref:Uncharacterized protein n=1 Tax=Epichloe bromicola TaxID=79588 RepID=A0ABQ0D053_9HYPO